MHINRPTRVALLATTALTAAFMSGCGSSSTPSGDHAMNGMAMSDTTAMTTTHPASHSMGGTTMQGMTPLQNGANGTTATAAGLTLKTNTPRIPVGHTVDLVLQVTDSEGMAVTKFERDQTKLMHLIVVRDDFVGYQHIHPVLGSGGHFTVPLLLSKPGRYHAIADFTTGGKRYALGVVLTVPGNAEAVGLPDPTMTAATDGYRVSLDHGTLKAGSEAQLTFTIHRGGQPVTALQPYLGAFGHLVALRTPDLAYSHVHPTGRDMKMGSIKFAADFPNAGTYRLFMQFRAAGKVHTAAFTVVTK